ncbi:Oligopeptide transport system permease protein OppC [Symmachiella dynata]|uniref:Oligopeptide transport system permease protein OppC n=1 Tax=Symmachiella dynata TaxID=2527995 RepID=A0A517ZJB3_9PLAN|nr:ABC transporter permease [Symmachiella dynata]QDU42570.1 Oligopeptide transport system permease protein OppC [Symmachiella dynata]
MILNWKESRAARKFFRSRSSILALLVISAYLAIAIVILVPEMYFDFRSWQDKDYTPPKNYGFINLEQTEGRVGTKNMPGFFLKPEPEKRLQHCEQLLEIVDRALKKPDPQTALAEIDFGTLKVADLPQPELKTLVDQGWKTFDSLATSANLNEAPEQLSKLAELEQIVNQLYPPPTGWKGVWRSFEMLLGTDRQGRSIMLRAIYSIKVAMQIGIVTALFAVLFGGFLGVAAGFFGGWVDHLVIWLYTTFSSIPNLVLLVLLAYMFTGTTWDGTLIPVYVAFGLTFWIGPCRVLRGETLKIKELEYVQAATAMGCGRVYIMLRHIIPNTAHLLLINFSLLFIGAIKSEVILSFLGLGVKRGPSWGIMISQSGSEVINSFFWQIGAATAFMFGLVLAFNIVSDALQDAFDPRHQ